MALQHRLVIVWSGDLDKATVTAELWRGSERAGVYVFPELPSWLPLLADANTLHNEAFPTLFP